MSAFRLRRTRTRTHTHTHTRRCAVVMAWGLQVQPGAFFALPLTHFFGPAIAYNWMLITLAGWKWRARLYMGTLAPPGSQQGLAQALGAS